MPLDPLAIATRLSTIFEHLNIRYAIGGAVASTLLGEPRATHDLDVVASIDAQTVDSLITAPS
jgi:hypothetical protein